MTFKKYHVDYVTYVQRAITSKLITFKAQSIDGEDVYTINDIGGLVALIPYLRLFDIEYLKTCTNSLQLSLQDNGFGVGATHIQTLVDLDKLKGTLRPHYANICLHAHAPNLAYTYSTTPPNCKVQKWSQSQSSSNPGKTSDCVYWSLEPFLEDHIAYEKWCVKGKPLRINSDTSHSTSRGFFISQFSSEPALTIPNLKDWRYYSAEGRALIRKGHKAGTLRTLKELDSATGLGSLIFDTPLTAKPQVSALANFCNSFTTVTDDALATHPLLWQSLLQNYPWLARLIPTLENAATRNAILNEITAHWISSTPKTTE